jgi:uncharacterized protein YhaN
MAVRIARFMISKPGIFSNRAVDLPIGLAVIYGRNGSGKSLLSRAIVETVWGTPSGAHILDGVAWSDLYLEIDAESEGGSYRYTRNSDKLYQVSRRSGGTEAALFHGLPGEGGDGAIRERILGALEGSGTDRTLYEIYSRVGCGDYMATCFIPSPTDALSNGSLRYDSLKPLFLDDSSRFYALYRQIVDSFGTEDMSRKVHNPLMNEILHHEMLIKDADKKVQIIDMQQSKGGKLAKERSILDEDIVSSERSTDELERRASLLQQSLSSMETLASIESAVRASSAELTEQETRRSQIEQVEFEIESRFPQFRDFSDSKRQNLKKLQETYREIRDVHVAIDKYHMDRSSQAWRTHLYSGITVIASLTLTYLVLKRGIFPLSSGIRTWLTALLLGLPLAFIGFLYARFMIAHRRSTVDEMWQRNASLEEKLVGILKENQITLDDHRLESIYEFLLQYFEEYGDYTDKQLDLFKLREGLHDDDWCAELRARIAAQESRRNGVRAEVLEALNSAGITATESADEAAVRETLLQIEKDISAEAEKREALVRQRAQLEEESAGNADFSAERETAVAEKERLTLKHRALCEHGEAMHFILDLFVEVVAAREEERLRSLARSTLDTFNHITGNQYITVLDDEQVRRFITSGDGPEGISAPLIYILTLAVKLGLSDLLVESGLPVPLIADDPFVFMDDVRAENLKSLLRDAAGTRQVIVFTQNSHHLDPGMRIEL